MFLMCYSVAMHTYNHEPMHRIMNLKKLGVNQKRRLACYFQLFDPSDYEVLDRLPVHVRNRVGPRVELILKIIIILLIIFLRFIKSKPCQSQTIKVKTILFPARGLTRIPALRTADVIINSATP